MAEHAKIARAAGIMSIATFISRILGYVRDMILAFYLGATGLSDTFFVAFRIPNLLRELFAEGSMSSAVIPVLSESEAKKGPSETERIVSITFTFLITVVGVLCVLGAIFAPAIVAAIAPGFVGDAEKFGTTVLLTRIMFPFLLFTSLSALFMGALNTRRVFFIPALAPAFLNIAIISTVLYFSIIHNQPLLGAAIGVSIGGLVQVLAQGPQFFAKGFGIRPSWNFKDEGFRKIISLVLPATIGMAVGQINIVVSNILASFLAEGSITYLFYSMRLMHFPVGIFGVAVATAVLPSLSSHAAKGDIESVRQDFSFALKLLFFITVPAMAGLIALRVPIVSALFHRGRFDFNATLMTAQALLFYSLGIWSMVGVRVVVAAFYSMQDTRTPVKIAIAALLTNIVLSLLLLSPMKHNGLALANATASMVNFTLLFYLLRKRLGRIGARGILSSFVKVSIASVIMGIAGWYASSSTIWSVSGRGAEKGMTLFAIISACIALYFIVCHFLKVEELSYVMQRIKKKLGGTDEN